MAWSTWQYLEVPYQKGGYREIPGSPAQYSGDFPLWRLTYSMVKAKTGNTTNTTAYDAWYDAVYIPSTTTDDSGTA